MSVFKKLKLIALLTALIMPLWAPQIAIAGEERAPPVARTSGTLTPVVMRAIVKIQELMTPEDPEDAPDLVAAKAELDELYDRRFERMNDFEKQTILNFYTNYWLSQENYPETILVFKQLLEIEELREDNRMRTLKTLGQLTAAEEQWDESILYYGMWRELSIEEDDIVFRGLSYAHYQIEEFEQSVPHWISYMQILMSEGEVLDRDAYSYLNSLYFILEDYNKALDLTKTMIVLFNDPIDWTNLSAVYSSLEEDERSIHSINLAYLLGHFDEESDYLRLGQSLGGMEIPYTGAKIIQDGMDALLVETEADNMKTLTQMHLIASEYKTAIEPATRSAELSETGDEYDTLGYLYYVLHDYAQAVEAFEAAIDKGDLDNRAATLLFLARSRYELDDFDGALEAARDSGEAGGENAQESASNYITFVNSNKRRFDILATRRADAIDFYETYPPLQ